MVKFLSTFVEVFHVTTKTKHVFINHIYSDVDSLTAIVKYGRF